MGVVLVGVDHTGEARAAMLAGLGEAQRRGLSILVVHHLRLGLDEEGGGQRRARGQRLLDEVAAVARDAGVEHDTRLEIGTVSAASALLTLADANDAEVIVIGTRKRSLVGKFLLGSDAQQIVLGAACQVLCVKDGQHGDADT